MVTGGINGWELPKIEMNESELEGMWMVVSDDDDMN